MSKTDVRTPEFRLSFPHLFVPHRANPTADEKYSAVMLFAPGTDLSAMAAAAQQAAKDEWGDNLPQGLKNPFRRGEDKLTRDRKRMAGYDDGVIFVTANTNQRPGVVDETVTAIIDQGVIYAGCYCRASINAFTYDVSGNIGVTFGLNNIQKLRDGEPFSARTSPEEDFTPVAVVGAADAASATGALTVPGVGGPAAAAGGGIAPPS